jgi:hypothetical protein
MSNHLRQQNAVNGGIISGCAMRNDERVPAFFGVATLTAGEQSSIAPRMITARASRFCNHPIFA